MDTHTITHTQNTLHYRADAIRGKIAGLIVEGKRVVVMEGLIYSHKCFGGHTHTHTHSEHTRLQG